MAKLLGSKLGRSHVAARSESLAALEEAVDLRRVQLGEDHPDYKCLSAWVPSVANTVEPAMTPRK